MLSDELDPLPYPKRIPALLRLLRERDDPGKGIAELAAGGPYERHLAVTAAAAFGARPVVVRALKDPDPSVRAEAVRQALRLGWTTGGEQLVDAPPVLRRLILRLLRGQPGSGDAVIDLVRDRYGDRAAVDALPACHAETVARLLPELARSVVSWKILARRHSAVILDWASDGLPAGERPVWSPFLTPVGACARAEPVRVLELLERHANHPLPEIDLTPVAARFPARVAALVTAQGAGDAYRYGSTRLLRHLRTLGVDDLVALDGLSAEFLGLLPPGRRAEVFAATPQEVPWEGRVELLPEQIRLREVRRVLALPEIAADESATRRWSRYLPAAEALPMLDKAAGDPFTHTRGEAYRWMVGVARREPAALPEVLRRLLRLRNERAAVRLPMLEELRTLVPHLVPGAAAALTAITDAEIEARDVSPRNQDALVELAYAALAGGDGDGELARWALGMIARLPIPWDLDTPLRRGQEHLVTAALRRRITADPDELFRLARLLEARARNLPELQELLHRAAAPAAPADVRKQAVELWLDDPRTRAARAAELLRADPAAARLAPVWREVSGYSTDLLDPALAGPPTYVRRWTPRQQRAYAETLARVAADTGLEQRSRTAALKNLARVPVAGRELLAGFLDSPEVPVAEAALAALPWTDRPDEALPVLLGYAGGDRARAALPAADRAARFVSAPALLALLRGVLLAPPSSPIGVTSRKAAVRILARYGPPESQALLAEVWHASGTHPDVRAVIITAVQGAPPSPIAWELLTAAAGSGHRAEVLALLGASAQELSEPDRRRFAALVVTACASPDRQISQDAFCRLRTWARWAPGAADLIVAALADPGFTGPGTYWPQPALRSLVEALLSLPKSPGPSALQPVFDRLVALDRQDPGPGTPSLDRPARRCVTRIVGDASQWQGPGDREPVRDAARKLASHPEFLGDGAELLIGLAYGDLARLTEVADLVAARPALAVRLAGQLADCGMRADRIEAGLATARRLADRGDLAGGLFALALVSAAGRSQRWSEPCQEALHHLRRHPHAEVADASYRLDMAG
ncbi:hypothetical protein [Actinoplanes sp. NPDC026623]|uniref:hypothetical protein n=1 Tax=Actinoplanes sp. NPDC026623 TaxID=3155610 RepID=UPI00340FB9A7